MLNYLLKKAELDKLQPVLNYLHTIDPRQLDASKKRKTYTWLIVLVSCIGLIILGIVVYKMFFEVGEDFDDEDFEDIDFDEDYDEDFEALVETEE